MNGNEMYYDGQLLEMGSQVLVGITPFYVCLLKLHYNKEAITNDKTSCTSKLLLLFIYSDRVSSFFKNSVILSSEYFLRSKSV